MAARIDADQEKLPEPMAEPEGGWTRQAVEDAIGGPARFWRLETAAGTYWMAGLNTGEGHGLAFNACATLLSASCPDGGTSLHGPALVIAPWEHRRK